MLLIYLISIFWAIIGGKKDVATPVPKDLGPSNLTKMFEFWVICYLRIMFQKFLTLDPPLKIASSKGFMSACSSVFKAYYIFT